MLAFAWNPLLAIEVAGSGHIDILGALLLVVSRCRLLRRWRAVAAVALALGRCGKVRFRLCLCRFTGGACGFAMRRWPLLSFGLLYLPFLDQGRIPMGSLGTYVQSFRFNDPVFEALER